MSDPNKAIEQKEGQSTKVTAKPQAAQPRARKDMPALTDDLCPTCHSMNIVRQVKRTWRIGEHSVYACRVQHRWSPLGGDKTLALLVKQQQKMRDARARVPILDGGPAVDPAPPSRSDLGLPPADDDTN